MAIVTLFVYDMRFQIFMTKPKPYKILSQNLAGLKYEPQNRIRLYISIAKPDVIKIPSNIPMQLKYELYNRMRLYILPNNKAC